MEKVETLNIKHEINKLYETIISINNFKGNRDQQEKKVMEVIDGFKKSNMDNVCCVCGKPNWQQLFKDFKLPFKLDFEGNKCAFCYYNPAKPRQK